MILTNYWKIYESLCGPFLSFTGKRQPVTHKEFLKALIKLLFLCNSEKYAKNVPGTSFKEYPKYSYIPHKPGPKPRFSELTPLNLTEISRETLLVFKKNSGRLRTSISAKITLISRHQHIKITTKGYCFICRNSKEVQNAQITKMESIVYGTTLKLLGEALKKILPFFKEERKDFKRIRSIIIK
jgi:hypothetical protein